MRIPLQAQPFSAEMRGEVQAFNCGTRHAWEVALNEWIKGERALNAIARGTRIWLYYTDSGALAAYGSLGEARWRWEPPDGEYMQIAFIPAVAIQLRFQGQPNDEPEEYKCSHQI